MPKKVSPSLFRVGRSGACEAILWKFVSWPNREGESEKLFVASHRLREAINYMVRFHPEFRIFQVQGGKIIEMISGSPLN